MGRHGGIGLRVGVEAAPAIYPHLHFSRRVGLFRAGALELPQKSAASIFILLFILMSDASDDEPQRNL